jgi:hypothetical protein
MLKWIRKILNKIYKLAHRIMFALTLVFYILVVVPYARLDKIIRRLKKEKPRICWGITSIINIRYGSMSARLYGYKSDTVVYTVSHINQRSDFDYIIYDSLNRNMGKENWLRTTLISLIASYLVFLWISLKYDIFHFYFDGSYLWPFGEYKLELPLLHLAGKKIIVLPYGGDARLESVTRKHKYNFCMDCTPATKYCDENKIRRRVEYFSKHADLVLGCADMVDTLPRWEGIWQYPLDLSEWPPTPPSPDSKIVKVVHATNHRMYKGTHFLISAIDELKSEGYPVELILVERMDNREARKIYEESDVIADQFIGGAYALFAIEGMALGKPVMCYLREGLYKYHPEWNECPIVNTDPGNIKQQLIRLINDKQLRQELGRRGPEYVKKYHSLESVGAAIDKYYRYLWFDEKRSWENPGVDNK